MKFPFHNAKDGYLNTCQISGKDNLVELIDLGNQPLSDTLIEKKNLNKEEKYFPLKILRSPTLGHSQLNYIVPHEELYHPEYPYRPGITKEIIEHHSEQAKKNKNKYKLNENELVVDIGSNDGTLLKFGAHLNAGLYNVKKFDNPVSGKFENNEYKNNIFPQLSLEISKPYFKNSKNIISTFTPKVLFVKSTKNAFNRKIPDESNINNFDLDFIDLFNVNRMHGNDRLEQSSRIDYGISYTSSIKDSFNDLTTIQIGQSHQFDRNKYLNKNTGISEKFSDIVGNLTLKPAKTVNFNSYFVIDKENFSIKTAYSNLLIRQKDSYLSLGNSRYSAVIGEDGEHLIDGKNQFSVKYDQKLYDFWNFTVYSTFDKKGKLKLYNYGTKIKYEDECFGMSFSWTRQYTHNPEDPTSNNFSFLFSLKEIMESDL